MTVHVGLVRAVMQGREGLTGDVLRDLVREAGGTDVRTYASTGNLLFRSDDGAATCAATSTAVTSLLGRPTPVLHRTAAHLDTIVGRGFFATAPTGAEHIVVFVDDDVDPAEDDGLATSLVGRVGRDLACVRASSGGAHPMPAVERLTEAPVTARSIRTVAGIVRAARTH